MNLEKFIETHRAAFEQETPAPGHMERMMARFEAAAQAQAQAQVPAQDQPQDQLQDQVSATAKTQSQPQAKANVFVAARRRRMGWIGVAACAVLLLGVGLFNYTRSQDPGWRCSQEDYLCYCSEIDILSRAIEKEAARLPEAQQREVLFNLKSLVPEGVASFEETLPEELSTEARNAYLVAYYSSIFEGVKQIKNNL